VLTNPTTQQARNTAFTTAHGKHVREFMIVMDSTDKQSSRYEFLSW